MKKKILGYSFVMIMLIGINQTNHAALSIGVNDGLIEKILGEQKGNKFVINEILSKVFSNVDEVLKSNVDKVLKKPRGKEFFKELLIQYATVALDREKEPLVQAQNIYNVISKKDNKLANDILDHLKARGAEYVFTMDASDLIGDSDDDSEGYIDDY